jgi:hypothetical protein
MAIHWLLRVGDGDHFFSSHTMKIWGITSKTTCTPPFLAQVKQGDILWFIKGGGTGGLVLGVAQYRSHCKRELGPLIAVTRTNEDLGWTKQEGNWDTEIHYEGLYLVADLQLQTRIKSPLTIRKYNEKCQVDLPKEYELIKRYAVVKKADS